MKVIFLDFDGVVNDIRNTTNLVVEEYVLNLKKIVELTGAKIVVSSSRKNEFIGEKDIIHEETYCYQNYEFPLQLLGIEIYDYTPYVEGPVSIRKELEIEAYLKGHPEIEEYVILDDDMVMKKFLSHQVFIEYSNGLLMEHIMPATAILNGQLGFYPSNYDIEEGLMERACRILDTNPFESDLTKDNLDKIDRIIFKYSDLKL